MILVIGGGSQGKLEFVRSRWDIASANITDGGTCTFEEAFQHPVLDHLHLLIRRLQEAGLDARKFIADGIEQHPDMILICDELSSAVVPVLKDDREMQETTGRILCAAAQKAAKVYRVFCSIPVLIKGEEHE
ncbi:hypothetical protein UNSWDHB_2860 [Dehalobacter sp. UNSWDHB]|jgi:hypothetical protein|uniref:hypothetical protein n=1 Tax=unclassified Dehalobacter TaxID=2635733 RepID=UPI00028A821B|nr:MULTISPECIES: hypothetical protein [unclassified Dehalobacter]AFV01776.1 hypothetical protein DHBDCA_p747 [Dehalobacter sp. DCA]AFV04812.1 hypothetical protein DCF50_p805 [Dehalobacter sp. CF]EQB19845.1 hypothetical protein UNSWDHB_2860 [Dehalobacter sp. UNSWDHB]